MKPLVWCLAMTGGLLAFGPLVARADVINFAGLTVNDPESPIPDGYAGFNWSTFKAVNTKTDANVLPSGYQFADADSASPNVAFNLFGNPASMTRAAPFSFYGAFFTAAWRDQLDVEVTGSLNGQVLFDKQFVLNSTGHTFVPFDFEGIDRLDFTSSGGTPHGYVPGKPKSHPPGTQFAMDDLVFVADPSTATPDATAFVQGAPAPEPAAFVLFAVGAMVAGAGVWKRRLTH